jgi:hypothetical protein
MRAHQPRRVRVGAITERSGAPWFAWLSPTDRSQCQLRRGAVFQTARAEQGERLRLGSDKDCCCCPGGSLVQRPGSRGRTWASGFGKDGAVDHHDRRREKKNVSLQKLLIMIARLLMHDPAQGAAGCLARG